jgi:hypothetical protein
VAIVSRRGVWYVAALAVLVASVLGPAVGRWLLMRDATATLGWLARSAPAGDVPKTYITSVGSITAAQRSAARKALDGDWRIRSVITDSAHDATWVTVQLSPDFSSLAGQVSSIRYSRGGWMRYRLMPGASELLVTPPNSDQQ